MKWSALWKILKVASENAPAVIALIQAVKHPDAPSPQRPGPA